jgi:RHH-type proline utilization regulon transcriptional repressor/proline dehydrogenase/delta 1-pyrroline-5-carboxylate dehydrogenase
MQALLTGYRQQINQYYLADELKVVKELLLTITDYSAIASYRLARSLVTAIRNNKDQQSLVEAFLHEYQLNSDEGIVLMEIAEALLRIPDTHTQDLFLQEKLSTADWHKHLQHSDSLLVNFATRTLDFTGTLEQQFKWTDQAYQSIFSELSVRVDLPVIRTAVS